MNNVDPYLYPGTDVLKNKKGIKDQSQLDALEEDIVPLRIIALRKEGLQINSVFDVQKIHKFLFEPLFDWAGKFRTITMYKKEPILNGCSVDYTPHDYIQKEMNDLEKKFQSIEWSKLSNNEKVIQASQGAIFELNVLTSNVSLLKELKEKGYKLVATSLQS